jgi:hypothetical protein
MLVHAKNVSEVMKEIQKYSNISFVSIDCEFTGCGNNKGLYDRDLELRYEAIKSLVNGHSLISLGITYWLEEKVKINLFLLLLINLMLRVMRKVKEMKKDIVFRHIRSCWLLQKNSHARHPH